MDQYVHLDSHHHLSAKYSLINTLTHWAKTVCNKPDLSPERNESSQEGTYYCKYPKWIIDRVESRLSKSSNEGCNGANTQGTTGTIPSTNEVRSKGHIVIPYTQGL